VERGAGASWAGHRPGAEKPAGDPPPVIFVGGTGRSGTHIVAKLLGRHGELEDITMEVRFHVDPGGFPDLLAGRISKRRFLRRLRGFWWKRYRGGGRPPDPLPWLALGRRPRGLHKLVSPERFEQATARFERAFDEAPVRACRELYLDLLWPLVEAADASGLVEMSTDNAAQAPILARIFPEAKFIHVVRDGRDASASRVRQGRHVLYPRTRVQGIRWWEQRVRRIESALAELPPERSLPVSLDLLVQPSPRRRGLHALLNFLGLKKRRGIRRYRQRRISPQHGNLGRWRWGLSARRQERVRAEYVAAIERLERDGARCAPMLRAVYEAERELAAVGTARKVGDAAGAESPG
jgi:Sulfotransferase family